MTPAPRTHSSRRYSDAEAAAILRADPGVRQTSPDPFEATAETISYMCELVRDSLADGIVQAAARDAAALAPDYPWAGCWWWVKHHLQFVHHSKMLGAWVGMPDELQLLIRPDALLKMERPKGDCAVYTTLLCAMLQCAGYGWEICTVAVDPYQPGVFSHVYPRVILADGSRVPLDASHGKYPGWEVPPERVSAKQIWDSAGNPVDDQDSGFRGLHGLGETYMYPGMGAYGLGDDGGTDVEDEYGGSGTGTSSTVGTVSTSTSTSTLNCPGDPGCPGYLPGTVTDSTGSTIPTSSGSVVIYNSGTGPTSAATSSETQALNSLASQFANIFGATQGVTSITKNANGTYSLTAPSGATTTSGSIAGLLASGSSSGIFLIAGGALLLILLMSLMEKH